jgi:predicted transcriptional regulator
MNDQVHLRMPSRRRRPSEIALEILDCIDKKGEATKWDLLKILGTSWQFHHWIEEFLLKEKFVEERKKSSHFLYRKTEAGNQFHELLRNGKIMRALIQVSGKRLRRK